MNPSSALRLGHHIVVQQLWEWAIVAGINAGVPDLRPHRWRHSWAWWLYHERQVPLVAISRLLGHAKITTTMTYLGTSDEQLMDLGSIVDDEEGNAR